MRRQFVVDRDFQGKFILTFVCISLAAMVIAIGVFNWLAMSAIEGLKWRFVVYESSLSEVILPYLIYFGLFAVLFSTASTAAVSWALTWKVAGPVYRLKKDIDSLAAGDLSIRFGLRRSDPFKDVASELSVAASTLRERFKKINADFKEVRALAAQLPETREDLITLKAEKLSHALEALEKDIKD